MEFTNVLRSYKMNLSNQAVGAIMMALQKAILHHEDISGLLKEFNLQQTTDGLIVSNPPVVHTDQGGEDADGDS